MKNLKKIQELIEQTYPDLESIPRTEKKGSICTNAETIEKCNHPGLNAISELNGLVKTDSTYVEVYRKAGDKPLHCSYDVLGASSGRTSSWNTNIQNQPRMPGIRECIKARDGWVFVSCDYDSQEIRTLGQVTQLLFSLLFPVAIYLMACAGSGDRLSAVSLAAPPPSANRLVDCSNDFRLVAGSHWWSCPLPHLIWHS